MPLVSIKGFESAIHTFQKTAANQSCMPQKPLCLPSHQEISRGSSRMCSASMLNFSGGSAGSALGNASWLLNSGTINHIPAGKQQRLQ
uniref:Uncharacterized protein n=1 Tax=Rhizophora mucronata TaxID=61149 RepID=A0A2P2QU80_RHIMU